MKNYEAIFILKPEEENITKGKSILQEEFESSGIKVIEQQDMGQKDLAYTIKKQDKGHYFCYKIQSEPDKLKIIDKNLRLTQEILKFVFFRDDKIRDDKK